MIQRRAAKYSNAGPSGHCEDFMVPAEVDAVRMDEVLHPSMVEAVARGPEAVAALLCPIGCSAVALPVLAGFGISSPEHVRDALSAGADGVICGSALIRRVQDNIGHPNELVASVYELAAALKAATHHQETSRC